MNTPYKDSSFKLYVFFSHRLPQKCEMLKIRQQKISSYFLNLQGDQKKLVE